MIENQIDRTRDFVAEWMAGVPIIEPKPRVDWRFTDEQDHARAIFECRQRNADRRKVFVAKTTGGAV